MKIFFKIAVYAFAGFWIFFFCSEFILILNSGGKDGSLLRLLSGLVLSIIPVVFAIKKLK